MAHRVCPRCGEKIEPGSVIEFVRVEIAWWNLWRGRLQWVHENCQPHICG